MWRSEIVIVLRLYPGDTRDYISRPRVQLSNKSLKIPINALSANEILSKPWNQKHSPVL